MPIHDNRPYHTHPVIQGLSWLENFLTPVEEEALLAQIDAAEWRRDDSKRRVQQYGWRYDHMLLGRLMHDASWPLPPWAGQLAERLAQERLLPRVPDQVIVNEYLGKQGITKHIDCKPCFEDGSQ